MAMNLLRALAGYGANLRVLVDKAPTAVEIDGPYGDRALILNRDGTNTGLPAREFSAAGPVVRIGVPGAAARRGVRRH